MTYATYQCEKNLQFFVVGRRSLKRRYMSVVCLGLWESVGRRS